MALADTLPVRLSRIDYGAPNINIYHFSSISGSALPAASPGGHIDLHIGNGLVRQYSLINSGYEPEFYVIAILRDAAGRGGSRAFHEDSVVGNEYVISKPRNNFTLVDDDRPVFLFAGGIGITPIINMYRTLRSRGRPVVLYYYARTGRDFVYGAELLDKENVYLIPTDELGVDVKWLADVVPSVPADAHLYCCGPKMMLDAFRAACEGRDSNLVHHEQFSQTQFEGVKNMFEVRLARSQKTLSIVPEATILQACLEANVDVSFSCEDGICGACEVRVIEGEVEHRDSVRSASEHNRLRTMMICCSRAAGTSITIDV